MKRGRLIIAIDGPAGAGKSTAAKRLAGILNYAYIDTGAMYRAVTLKALQEKIDLTDQAAVEAIARKVKITFIPGQAGKLLLEGDDVSRAIRTPEVSRAVSAYAASYPGVRKVMVASQQAMGKDGGVVMEGRDITTVVFPDAEVKIFLAASQEERARRRYAELKSQGREQPFTELLADLKRRDEEDLRRPGGALREAPDAAVINSTGLTISEVVRRILRMVRQREPRPKMHWRYQSVLFLARQFARRFFQLKHYGQEWLPLQGGFILASNHASHLDPPFLAVSVARREIHFMARSTLFKPALFGWLIKSVNAHPIVRGQGPLQDWDFFVNLLRQGGALLVFPEGTRTETGELQRGKSGFGKLVYMSKAPVYPAYVDGSFTAWPKNGKIRRHQVSIYFGEPVELSDLLQAKEEKRILREIAERVMAAVGQIKQNLDAAKKMPA